MSEQSASDQTPPQQTATDTEPAAATSSSSPAEAPAAESHEFSAEVGRLLDLVVHSLYSDREIFLRELVANAADATDRRRFEALTDPAAALPDGAKIRINPDKPARQLIISDDGTGMSREELVRNLGTIARSGTRAFGQTLSSARPEERPSLIGQFGVGFYAAFMVAERVEVTSRRVGSEEAWRWSSEGGGSFTLSPASRDQAGTDIVLHMKPDADEFLESYRLETIVRKWADHITWPITVLRDGKEVSANEGTALWRKPKNEITEEQLTEFYQHLGHAFDKPWATLHWRAEGTLEFTAMLFIPTMRPFEPVESVRESRVRLHVRRMFITDEAELLPPWLRFVQGIVDTEDLPLNVSREMLQATPVLARIRKAVTNRVLTELRSKAKDAGSYVTFWEAFGPVVKEGLWEDAEHRTELAGLARFRSTHEEQPAGDNDAGDQEAGNQEAGNQETGNQETGNQETGDQATDGPASGAGRDAKGWTSLEAYVSRMKPGQEAIYYLNGDSIEALSGSAQLEGFRARGLEVLLLADPVDAFWPERLDSFADKKLRSVTQGQSDLSKFAVLGASADEADGADVTALLAALKEVLGDDIKEARATDRLVRSPVVLAASDLGPDLQMQRLMRRSGQRMPLAAPVLEVNPRHALIRALAARHGRGEPIEAAARTLLDLARVQDGELPADPAGFAQRVGEALAATLSLPQQDV